MLLSSAHTGSSWVVVSATSALAAGLPPAFMPGSQRMTLPSLKRNRTPGIVDVTAHPQNVAAFAAHLATSLPHRCHIVATSLPLLAAFATHNAKRQVAASRDSA